MAATLGAGAAEAKAVQAVEQYCNASWNNAHIARQDWDDCTQETFKRLLERVSRNQLVQAIADAKSRERRELIRCIWCTEHSRRRSKRHYSLNSEEIPDKRSGQTSFPQTLDEIREVVQDSAIRLTPRQRKILTQWLDGDSIPEIAENLAISHARVSDEKYKALRKLRRILG